MPLSEPYLRHVAPRRREEGRARGGMDNRMASAQAVGGPRGLPREEVLESRREVLEGLARGGEEPERDDGVEHGAELRDDRIHEVHRHGEDS